MPPHVVRACWYIGSSSFFEIWFISIRNHIFQAVSLWLHFCSEAFHKNAEDNWLLLPNNGISLSPSLASHDPCLMRSLSLLSGDVSLFLLFSSSHQPPTALSCPPHHSSLATHLPASPEPLHQCQRALYFTGQQPSTHTQTHTHISEYTCMSTHTVFSYSHACTKIVLLFLLQSLSLSQTHKKALFCLPLSMLWNASTCFGRPWLIHHCRTRLGCIKSPSV